jgi:hypothetical protein
MEQRRQEGAKAIRQCLGTIARNARNVSEICPTIKNVQSLSVTCPSFSFSSQLSAPTAPSWKLNINRIP